MLKRRASFTRALELEIDRQRAGAERRARTRTRLEDAVSGRFRVRPPSPALGGGVTVHVDRGAPVVAVDGVPGTTARRRARAASRRRCHDAAALAHAAGVALARGSSAGTPAFDAPDAVPTPEEIADLPPDPQAALPSLDRTLEPVAAPSNRTSPAAAPADRVSPAAPVSNRSAATEPPGSLVPPTSPPASGRSPDTASPGTIASPRLAPSGAADPAGPSVPADPATAVSPTATADEVLAPGGASDAEEAEKLLQELLAESSSLSSMSDDNAKLGRQLGAMASEAKLLRHRRAEETAEEPADEDDEDARVEDGQGEAAPRSLGHDFFDRLGDEMRFSNTFDVGSFDVSERLRAFEKELEHEPLAERQPTADAFGHDELAAELSAIRAASDGAASDGAASAPAGTAAPGAAAGEVATEPDSSPSGASPVDDEAPTSTDPSSAPGPAPSTAPDAAPKAPPEAAPKAAPEAAVIIAGDGLDAGAAAAATLVADLHGLPRSALDVMMRRAGWNAYAGTPPAGLLDAAEHFGLTTVDGDVARDPDRLAAVLDAHGRAALAGANEAGVVRIVSRAGAGTPQRPFEVIAVDGPGAGARTAMTHRQLLTLFHTGTDAVPLVLAHV